MKMGRSKKQHGQGVVEYVLVTALVALAAMTIFRSFREDLRTAYRRAGEALVEGVSDGVSDSSGE